MTAYRSNGWGLAVSPRRPRSRQALARLAGAASVALLAAACTTTQLETAPPDLPLTEGERVQPPAGNTVPQVVAPESAAPPDPADAVPAPGVVEDVPQSPEPAEQQD